MLAEYSAIVSSEDGILIVHDAADAPTGNPAYAIRESRRHVAAASADAIIIQCADQQSRPSLRIQLWPDQPPAPSADFERGPSLHLYLASGRVSACDLDPTLSNITVPTGAGQYRINIVYRDRDKAAAAIATIRAEQAAAPLSAPNLGDFDRTAGIETYLIQIWPADSERSPHVH